MCYGFDGHRALQDSLQQRGTDRRGFLRGAAAAAAGSALVGVGASPASAVARDNHWKRVPPGKISIQLYTLRTIMQGQGVESTLATLAKTGYPKVELAGYYGRSAAEMRQLLASVGLQASSSHDGIAASTARMHEKFQNAVTLGQKFIVVPYLNSPVEDDWRRWADQMNAEAAVAKSYGLAYGYHNHAHEFTIDLGGGLTPWEVLTGSLDPSLVHLEADLYWVVTGGLNSGAATNAQDAVRFAVDTIAQTPQRVRQYHVKDKDAPIPDVTNFADLGTGFIDFREIFEVHAVDEYIVENDQPDVTPIQTARVGYSYLRNLRF